jgi:hypothetical protein
MITATQSMTYDKIRQFHSLRANLHATILQMFGAIVTTSYATATWLPDFADRAVESVAASLL